MPQPQLWYNSVSIHTHNTISKHNTTTNSLLYNIKQQLWPQQTPRCCCSYRRGATVVVLHLNTHMHNMIYTQIASEVSTDNKSITLTSVVAVVVVVVFPTAVVIQPTTHKIIHIQAQYQITTNYTIPCCCCCCQSCFSLVRAQNHSTYMNCMLWPQQIPFDVVLPHGAWGRSSTTRRLAFFVVTLLCDRCSAESHSIEMLFLLRNVIYGHFFLLLVLLIKCVVSLNVPSIWVPTLQCYGPRNRKSTSTMKCNVGFLTNLSFFFSASIGLAKNFINGMIIIQKIKIHLDLVVAYPLFRRCCFNWNILSLGEIDFIGIVTQNAVKNRLATIFFLSINSRP